MFRALVAVFKITKQYTTRKLSASYLHQKQGNKKKKKKNTVSHACDTSKLKNNVFIIGHIIVFVTIRVRYSDEDSVMVVRMKKGKFQRYKETKKNGKMTNRRVNFVKNYNMDYKEKLVNKEKSLNQLENRKLYESDNR